MYAARDTSKKQIAAKRLLRTRNTFSQSIMVSVGVSKLGSTELIFFVDPGTKINSAYYRDILLRQKLMRVATGGTGVPKPPPPVAAGAPR